MQTVEKQDLMKNRKVFFVCVLLLFSLQKHVLCIFMLRPSICKEMAE